MNLRRAFLNSRCCSGASPPQSRQNEARTSRVGIERLRPLVEGAHHRVVALEAIETPGSEILIGLALPCLPGRLPEPGLSRVNDLLRAEQDSVRGHLHLDKVPLDWTGGSQHLGRTDN